MWENIHISKHAIVRYAQRFRDNNIKDITELDPEMLERYETNIKKTLENSEFIYRGKFYAHGVSDFYLADDIILVVDSAQETLCTMYRIDFGYDDEINRSVKAQLLGKLHKLRESIDEKESLISIELSELDNSITVLKAEKADLEASLEAVNNALDVTKKYRDTVASRASGDRAAYAKIARNLCYSVCCKVAFNNNEDIAVD